MGKYEPLTKFISEWSSIEDIYTVHDAIYAFCEAHPEEGYNSYREILETAGIAWDRATMVGTDVSGLEGRIVIALLLGACRAERFCDDAFQDIADSGAILRWLERLREIDTAEAGGCETVCGGMKKTLLDPPAKG